MFVLNAVAAKPVMNIRQMNTNSMRPGAAPAMGSSFVGNKYSMNKASIQLRAAGDQSTQGITMSANRAN